MGFPRKDFKRSSLCYRCEQDHPPDRCRYKKAVCRNCGKIGHIQRACRSQGRQHWGKPQTGVRPQLWKAKAVKSLHLEDAEELEELVEYKLNTVVGERDKPLVVTVEIEGKELKMEVDTGAAVSLVSYETYCQLLPEIALSPSNVVLRTYSGELINVAGSCKVEVCHNGQKVVLDLIVVMVEAQIYLGGTGSTM